MRKPLRVLTAAIGVAAVLLAGCSSTSDDALSEADPTPSAETNAASELSDTSPQPDTGDDAVEDTAEVDSPETDDPADGPSEEEATWPRTIIHDAGETVIDAQPVTVVSTSVTLTGILLAIDAPLTASAAATPSPLTDDRGFFTQWTEAASIRGVEVLYPNLTLDLEAIDQAAPDLIVGSTIGQDNTIEAYDQLSEIAPTILFDYGAQDWTSLAIALGEALSLEDDAAAAINEYDAYLTDLGASMTVPEGSTLMLSYLGADGTNIFNPSSAQAHVLTSLGFDYADVDPALIAQTRSDIVSVSAENLPAALMEIDNVFVLKVGASSMEAFTADPLLANINALRNGSIQELGPEAFRIDPFSGRLMADDVAQMYAD